MGDILAINDVSRRACSLTAHAWAGAQLKAVRRRSRFWAKDQFNEFRLEIANLGRRRDMSEVDRYDKLFVFNAFFIQIILLVFFALRRWKFDTAMKCGWIVYALSVPAVIVSLVLLIGGKPWYIWLSGFLYAVWAMLGYVVDIARPVAWRSPILWPVIIPYVLLYLSSLMFYWWPLGNIQRPLWFIYAVLFVISTILNISSHI